MYLDGEWYSLTFKPHVDLHSRDSVLGLDVSLLQNYVLSPILGIQDPRTDKGIEFVGGIRGLDTLQHRADRTEGVAFSMYATSMEELLVLRFWDRNAAQINVVRTEVEDGYGY